MPADHTSSIDRAVQASALIAHIQTRYHDAHRRVLEQMLAHAGPFTAVGLEAGLLEELAAIGGALEQHMFKEEMRLFPMMEQGGNTLMARLIEDLHREHDDHLAALQAFQCQLRATHATGAAQACLSQFSHDIDDFACALAEHIRLEDEVLFPLFLDSGCNRGEDGLHAIDNQAQARSLSGAAR